MSESESYTVNFGRPMALFPLDSAVLLPQQVLPLHIFEPRYHQMVARALDGPGQFAMAVFEGQSWRQNYHGRPPLRRSVCVCQIMQHEALPGDRFNLLVQGLCRARVKRELPAEEGVLYRTAIVEPSDLDQTAEQKLYGVRERLTELLSEGPLAKLNNAPRIVERIRNEDIDTTIILELVSFSLPTDREVRYLLLDEPDAGARAELVERELLGLQRLIGLASAQHPEQWPKGCSWN